MADTKISALPAATLPLAGTEVLPIVQSSSTKKVATDDLTVKNIRSNATSGILQIAGPAASTTRTMTVPNANFTAARTDAAQSFTGDQTLSTGNLIQGTAAKGFNFTANTPAAGMTSQLLNWYEEGTWTPTVIGTTSAGTATYPVQIGRYTRIGNRVFIDVHVAWNSGTGTGNLEIAGLPFTSNSAVDNLYSLSAYPSGIALSADNYIIPVISYATNNITLKSAPVGGGSLSDVAYDPAGQIVISGNYCV